jgi:hypothetical protein
VTVGVVGGAGGDAGEDAVADGALARAPRFGAGVLLVPWGAAALRSCAWRLALSFFFA